MRSDVVSTDRIRSAERLDPGFYVHAATGREWSVSLRPLSDVANISRRERIEEPPEGSRFLDEEQEGPSVFPPVREIQTPSDRKYLQWSEPDEVILHRSDPDRCFCLEEKMLVSMDYWIIRVEPDLAPAFLAIALRSRFIREDMIRRSTGHVRYRISKSELQRVGIPCPDLDRQRRVVEAYRDDRGEIRTRSDLIEAIDAFQDRLSFRKREVTPRFTVPAGDLDERLDPWHYRPSEFEYDGPWDTVDLGEAADVSLGRVEDERRDTLGTDEEWPVVRTKNLDALLLRLDEDTEHRFPEPEDPIAKEGDTVLSRYLTGNPTIAHVDRADGVILEHRLLVIRPDTDRLDPFYLTAYLLTGPAVARMYTLAQPGTRRKRLSAQQFEQIQIPLPDPDDQKTLVEDVKQVHESRCSLQRTPPPENPLIQQFIK